MLTTPVSHRVNLLILPKFNLFIYSSLLQAKGTGRVKSKNNKHTSKYAIKKVSKNHHHHHIFV